jgi:hypothetical protein
MSTAGSYDSHAHSFVAFPVIGGEAAGHAVRTGPAPVFDAHLIPQTRNEVRILVEEITQLSRAVIPASQFYEEFLRRVISALAAHGGAVWISRDGGPLELEYEVNLPDECRLGQETAGTQHSQLLQNVFSSGQATLVPPRSGAARGDEAGNPSDSLLILAAIKVDQQPCGVIEVVQRAGGGPTTQRGYLRFLVQMAEVANEFLRNSRLRHQDDRQSVWTEFERFLRLVHGHLDSQRVACTVANESRRLIGCDRASVATAKGRGFSISAVSGLDSIESRAADIRLLGELVRVVCATGRPFWYDGRQSDIAPQIERPLNEYLDHSHATLLAIVPLLPPAHSAELPQRNARREPVGALIIEQFSGIRVVDGMVERTESIAQHSASALSNALEHESIFLLPVWRAIGRAKWVVRARSLPKAMTVCASVVVAVAALGLIPVDFDLAARGKLQPAVRRDVFARVDGVVTEVPVQHQQIVEKGQILARISSTELEAQIADLIGRKQAARERTLNLQPTQLDDRNLQTDEQNRPAGESLELRKVEEGIDREIQLLREKEEQLTVRSEIRGMVETWNVGTILLRRPVQRGQLLMSVVDPDGAWELELYMPERRIDHLAGAVGAQKPLSVSFRPASHPERVLTGSVTEIDRIAEQHGEDGNCVRLRVAVDKHDLPELHAGTSVTARVKCGRRCLGFVLFHELIEALQSKVLFWL